MYGHDEQGLLRRGKALVQRSFTGLWGMGFAALGRRRAEVARWCSAGGGQVLVVAPHPDDEVCGCGGTLLLHRRAGDRVSVLYVTDGRRSTAYGLAPEEMARRRRDEAHAACSTLDVEPHWLGLAEGEWTEGALVPAVQRLLREMRPTWIYAPSRIDFHPEHRRAAVALARALVEVVPSASRLPRIRVVQYQVPLTATLTNLVSGTAAVAARCRDAFAAYATQLGAILPCLRCQAYAARYHALPRWAEVFWELDGESYARLHLEGPKPPPSAFRSLRHYAWSDPLAYAVGRRQRRQCRDWVARL